MNKYENYFTNMFGQLKETSINWEVLPGYPKCFLEDDYTEDCKFILTMPDELKVEICYWHEADLKVCDISIDKAAFDKKYEKVWTFERYMQFSGANIDNIRNIDNTWDYCGSIDKEDVYRIQYIVAD